MSAFPLIKQRLADSTTIGVLLVSPNERLRHTLREKLHHPRWSLSESASGAEAIEFLHENSCEILLLDPQIADLEFNEFSAMVGERFPNVQILTVNAQTGQLVLGSTSPTALSEQLAEMLHTPAAAPAPATPESQGHRLRLA